MSNPKSTYQMPTPVNLRIRRILRTHPHLERRTTWRPDLCGSGFARHNPPQRDPLIERRQPYKRLVPGVQLRTQHGFLDPRGLELHDGVSVLVRGVVEPTFEVDFEHGWVPRLEGGEIAERF